MIEQEKKALITGATGFVGLNLAIALLNEGWLVNVVIRKNSNIEKLQKLSGNKIIFYLYDEQCDLNHIVKQAKPTVVFHLASLFLPQHQYKDIAGLIDSNIKLGTELVEAMVQNEVFLFINTGTAWQHYKNEDYNPVNLYAASKQAFECMVRYYQKTTPLKVITLKLFDTYGKNDTRPKLFTLLSRLAETGEKLEMSKGEQKIDLVYIDDVIQAYILAAQYLMEDKKECIGEYAVTSGQQIPLTQIVRTYENVIGRPLNIYWGGRPYRSREVMNPWNRGKTLEGWRAKVKLKDGIEKVISFNDFPE